MSSSQEPRRGPDLVVVTLALLVAGFVATLVYLGRERGGGDDTTTAAGGAQVFGAPSAQRIALELPPAPARTAAVLDVREPSALFAAARKNAWLQDVLGQPLGRGFLGSWAGFLGSRGEDLGGAFSGTVLEFVVSRLLDEPFRVAYFTGEGVAGTPAIVVPQASGAARGAFELMTRVAGRGVLVADGCPAESDGPPTGGPFEIQRWLLADHPVFAAARGDDLVVASRPRAVLNALCAELPAREVETSAAVALTLVPESFGREAQLLAHLFGFAGAPRIELGLDGDTLAPRGVAATLSAHARLGSGPLSAAARKLVPEEAPIVLAARLALPARLDTQSLKTFLRGEASGELVEREVVLAWFPRGDASMTTELALVWSRPADAEELRQLFSGKNRLQGESLCDAFVLASSASVLARFTRACQGGAPSLAHTAPAVRDGLARPWSVGMVVQTGKLLSGLLADAHATEAATPPGKTRGAPPELEEARRTLEALPTFGFVGRAEATQLVPGGFRS